MNSNSQSTYLLKYEIEKKLKNDKKTTRVNPQTRYPSPEYAITS
jgi:hypothetical protein